MTSVTRRARELRRSMTKPEIMLWTRLRAFRPLGFHMRRQAPAGPFFADFACYSAKLIVEVDGRQHDEAAASAKDRGRDRLLAERGFETMRFAATEVLRNPDDVARQVLDRLRERSRDRRSVPSDTPTRPGR